MDVVFGSHVDLDGNDLKNVQTADIEDITGGLSVSGGKSSLAGSTSSYASLNLPPGTAPTSPANGDVWTTSAGMFVRVAGTTVGPLATVYSSTSAPTGGDGHIGDLWVVVT